MAPIYTGVIGCGDVVIICILVAQLAVMVTSLCVAKSAAE